MTDPIDNLPSVCLPTTHDWFLIDDLEARYRCLGCGAYGWLVGKMTPSTLRVTNWTVRPYKCGRSHCRTIARWHGNAGWMTAQFRCVEHAPRPSRRFAL